MLVICMDHAGRTGPETRTGNQVVSGVAEEGTRFALPENGLARTKGIRGTTMLTPEETRVLAYLRKCRGSTVADLAAACFGGTTSAWVSRAVANLDWLGYITIFRGRGGEPTALQLTEMGQDQATE